MEIGELERLGALLKKAEEVKSIEEMISAVVIPFIGVIITVLLKTSDVFTIIREIMHVGRKEKRVLVRRIYDISFCEYCKEFALFMTKSLIHAFFLLLLSIETWVLVFFTEIRLNEISVVFFLFLLCLCPVIFYGIRCLVKKKKAIYKKIGTLVGFLFGGNMIAGVVVQFIKRGDDLYTILLVYMLVLLFFFFKLENDLMRRVYNKYSKILQLSKYIRYSTLFVYICHLYIVHLQLSKVFGYVYFILWLVLAEVEYLYIDATKSENYAMVVIYTTNGRYETKKKILQYNKSHKFEYELENGQKHIVDEAEVSKIVYQKKYMYRKKYGNVFVNLIQNEEKLKFDGYKIMNAWICFWKIKDSCKEVVMLKAEDVQRIEVN